MFDGLINWIIRSRIKKINFSMAPIFFPCPYCGKVGFIYIGDAGNGHKLYRCDHCHMVIAE